MIKIIKKKKNLGQRTIGMMVVFSVCLILGISALSSSIYLNLKINDTHKLVYAYAKAASMYIDGDKVLKYLDEDNRDPYFYKIGNYLDTVRSSSRLKFLYVIIPTEKGSYFVWDAKNKDATENYTGKTDPYEEISHSLIDESFKAKSDEKLFITKSGDFGYLVSALYPILNSSGEPVALVGADIAVNTVSSQSINFIGTIILSIIVLVLIFSVLLYRHTKKRIIAPLIQLSDTSKKLITSLNNGSDINLDIHTGDEIEELAESFKTMHSEVTSYLGRLSKITAEKEHIGTEMHVASNIQASMLPKLAPYFASHDDFKVYASMTPAKEVGGDFYDAFLIDENHLGIVIADVSDKGVPAALFMAVSKTLIKHRCLLSGSLSPAYIFKTVNNQLIENNDAGMFVTTWLAIIDLKTGEGYASNAGHEHPVICHKGGDFKLVEYQHSPPLGCLSDMEFEEHKFKLSPGDMLFVYTDGVAEATNEKGELYTTDRLVVSLNSHKGLEPQELVEAVHKDIDRYVGNARQFDDITMLAFKYH